MEQDLRLVIQDQWLSGFTCSFQLTVADFPLYEVLDVLRVLKPGIVDDSPKLKDFLNRFEALPAIKKYMESDQFLKRPLFSAHAGYSIANP